MSKAQVLDSGTSQMYVTVRAHVRNAAPSLPLVFSYCFFFFLLFLYVSTFEKRVQENGCLAEDLRRWFVMQAGKPEFTPLFVH